MTGSPRTDGPVSVGTVLAGDDRRAGPLSVAQAQGALCALLGRQARQAEIGPLGQSGHGGGDIRPGRGDIPDQVSVIAGHPGAGSSTVALAVADAAAAQGRSVHLLDPCAPGRSGLVAASGTELGTDPTGAWRRGRRTSVVIERRALLDDTSSAVLGQVVRDELTVLDLGSVETTTATAAPTVVVCRANVPGVRLVEQRLQQLPHRPLVVAVVGPHGWAREVRATVGPRLAGLRETGLVVSVPWDSRVEIAGLTDRPLPRPLVAAGEQLLLMLRTAEHFQATRAVATEQGDR